jgi:hypothetical protein
MMSYLKKVSVLNASSLFVLTLFCLLTASVRPLAADACTPLLSGVTSASRTSSVALSGVSQGRSVDSTALSNASSNWNGGCSGYDNPQFSTSGTADIAVNVIFYSGTDAANGFSCSGKCACTDTQITGGAVSGATVRMFERQGNGTSCTGAQSEVLTHELGHVLGLGDPPAGASCSGRIMGDLFGSIGGAECTTVDGNFFTRDEVNRPSPGDGQGPCGI